MILLLDNYDSFTYNLYHCLTQLSDEEVVVKRNDEIALEEVANFNSIILSPGPGLPADSGIMPELLLRYSSSIPILGICLGHQAIGEAFGAKLINLKKVLHGVQREVIIDVPNDRLLKGLPSRINSGHYHSWVVASEALPDDLQITARDTHGAIMALSHKKFPVSGVQFHPESVLTDAGMTIMSNWLHYCDQFRNLKKSPVSV